MHPSPAAAPAPGDDDGEPVIERKLDDAFTRIVEEGGQRLGRGWPAMAATGAVAGIEVGMGTLALLVVERRTGSTMLASVAFSVGFLALLLGHSELFTEGFLVPVTTVAARHGRVRDLARLWVTTFAANLAGGWVVTWLIVVAFPSLGATARHAAASFLDAGLGGRSAALAVLAGAAITLMTRMQHGTDDMTAKMAAAVGSAFLLAGLPLFHSILDSLVIFTALHAGDAHASYGAWAGWVAWVTLWNVLGGIGLVTLLRLLRSGPRVRAERRAA